ncbi:MAG TPA: DUF4160 domain-containing protein [Cyclobacteriaceae bacterium]|nr:DUF4160 domain-containing protein [Cyclobacteriaceae bacterium]
MAVYKFLTFFIFSYDALNEPPHLHVVKEKGNRQRSAKIWLHTSKVETKGTLSNPELNLALQIISKNREVLIETFEKVKSGEKVKTIKFK